MTALAAVAVTGGAAAPVALPLKSAVSGALSLGAHILDNRSLETMIEDLSTHLLSIDCRLLVIVDDLDRLQPDELRQILTLVKTFGNLPNITHVLAYDRDIVNSALENSASASRNENLPTFLEKIVQAEFDLPYPTSTGLSRLMTEKFTTIFGSNSDVDAEDWFSLKRVALDHYVRSPRDVLRLCNALSVIWPSVEKEIYIPDLIAVELLRHHDHATYDLIRGQKDYMTGRGPPGPENREQLGQRILESIETDRRRDVSELLARMFPAVAQNLKIQFPGYRGTTKLLAGRRINSPYGFDSYFRFAPPIDEISIHQLQQVTDHINDEGFRQKFIQESLERRRSDGTSFVGTFLENLPQVLDLMDRIEPALFRALLKLGDQIIEQADQSFGFFAVNNQMRLGPILRRIFQRMNGDFVQESILGAVDDPEVGIGTIAYIVAYIGADFGLVWDKSKEAEPDPLLSQSEVEAIGTKLATKIEKLGKLNTLPILSTIYIILRVWTTFGKRSEARAWISKNLCDPTTFVKLAFSQMGQVSSSNAPYNYRELRGTIDEGLFDLPLMLRLAKKHRNSDTLNPDDLGDLQRFIDGLERKQEGATASMSSPGQNGSSSVSQ